ncbi:MAG: hypothetical protein Q9217_004232 [Psora testacea]
MPSLPSMPSPTKSSKQIDDEYVATQQTAMQHMQRTKSRVYVKKAMISPGASSPPVDDFILFPDEVADKRYASQRDDQCRRMTREAMRNISLPKPAVADGRLNQLDLPQRKRAPRHGGFKIVPLLDDEDQKDEEIRRPTSKRPPPAPSPQLLATPDLSDVEEDVFCSCFRNTGEYLDFESEFAEQTEQAQMRRRTCDLFYFAEHYGGDAGMRRYEAPSLGAHAVASSIFRVGRS